MKYAFYIFALLISINSFARQIHSINDSKAIMDIAMYMEDNHEDFVSYYKLSDLKINLPVSVSCSDVSASDVLKEYKKSFSIILRKFPDEDLPYQEALEDMKDFLDNQSYKRCVIDQNLLRQSNSKSIYYYSLDDKIHLRVDNIAPSKN